MSSILCRPDSRKTSINPDASTLRKLVRDPKCRQVLRGILESLLHYITQDVPRWTTRNKNLEKLDCGAVAQTNTGCLQLQTNCKIVKILPQVKSDEASQNTSQKNKLQKHRLPSGGDERAGNQTPRRLTTFHLLQSKFTRCTPKPPVTHQREVGTLFSNAGVRGNVNDNHDDERNRHRRGCAKREQGLKRQNSVKDMVAKFAMAEQREQGLKKQPIKPRLIGKGILLSSLTEKFEAMATVCKASDFKCSHEKPSTEVKVTKEKVTCLKKWQQQVENQTVHIQNTQRRIKSKCTAQKLKGNQITKGQEQRAKGVEDILSKVDPNPEEQKNHIKEKQMRDPPSDKKASFTHACDIVESCATEEKGKIQGAADENQSIGLKCGCVELLCFMSVTEWLSPHPYRLLPQVEEPLKRHMVTITTCYPVCSTCVDYLPEQDVQDIKPRASPCQNMDMRHGHGHEEERPCGDLTYSQRRSVASDISIQDNATSEIMDGSNIKNDPKDPNQKRSPHYIIPRVYSCDSLQGADQINYSSQPALQPETPLDAMPPSQPDTALSTVLERTQVATKKQGEEKEKEEVQAEKKEVDLTQQSLRPSNDTNNKAEDSEITLHERDAKEQKPKYTTINYGDPSVKQTFKPKVIRFTDTFTF